MLYLKDLRDGIRKQVENEIKTYRPDLVKSMNDGDDIEIGEIWEFKKYKLAD